MDEKRIEGAETQRREIVAAQEALDFERSLVKRERTKLAEQEGALQRRLAELEKREAQLRAEQAQLAADREAFDSRRFAYHWDSASGGTSEPGGAADGRPSASTGSPPKTPAAVSLDGPGTGASPKPRSWKGVVIAASVVLVAVVVWLLWPGPDGDLAADVTAPLEDPVDLRILPPSTGHAGNAQATTDAGADEAPQLPPDLQAIAGENEPRPRVAAPRPAAKAVQSAPTSAPQGTTPPTKPVSQPAAPSPKGADKKAIDDLFNF
jgi:hypothetical protein